MATLGLRGIAAVALLGTAGGALSQDSRMTQLVVRAQTATADWTEAILECSQEFGIEPALIAAVITVESKGDPFAISSAGAAGLMQLMPATCSDFGVYDPFDPVANIRGGAAVLASHSDRYGGNLVKVLAAYNAGRRRADDGSWRRLKETRAYVPKVLSIIRALRQEGTFAPAAGRAAVSPIENGMLEVVRKGRPDLTEDPDLRSVASAVLREHVFGGLTFSRVEPRALKLQASKRGLSKGLKVYVMATASIEDFGSSWQRQNAVAATAIGLAHVTSISGHHWLVILANP